MKKKKFTLEVPGNAKEILLHTCCAPCSSAIIECLMQHDIRPTIYYCNPNIYPLEEYNIRKNECSRYAQSLGLDIIDADDESNNKESFDLNNLNYDEEYDTDEVIAFVPSEDMPVFPENIQKWLSKHVKYPQIALENGVQGKVFVQFVVEKDGSVSNIKVVRGVDASLDKEAVRVVSVMPKWKPGKQRGKAVRVAYTLPIAFQIGSY